MTTTAAVYALCRGTEAAIGASNMHSTLVAGTGGGYAVSDDPFVPSRDDNPRLQVAAFVGRPRCVGRCGSHCGGYQNKHSPGVRGTGCGVYGCGGGADTTALALY